MKKFFNDKLIKLSQKLNSPLYVVGGFVRNFLINGCASKDIDLASAILAEELLPVLEQCNLKVVAQYKRTGTVVFSDGETKYEYTSFREDNYSNGGEHVPDNVIFTKDIYKDALRRDFKCNAIYYDIKNDIIVDPLDGIKDIKNKVLDTVKAPKEVFSHDGLRLMRLARFSAELSFKPTEMVLKSAKDNAKNIKQISPERIFAELKKILSADKKYEFSDKNGHYSGLKILDQTRVLDGFLPELALGRNMAQRSDFHSYDVLEHSLKCVLYAKEEIRLTALLHDIGKPFCMKRDGKYHFHAEEGKNISRQILSRLKADNSTKDRVEKLIGLHMLDLKKDMKESTIRRYIVKNQAYFSDLMALKQADFSACKDDLSDCPTVVRWKEIYQNMLKDGTPFSFKDLKITASDLILLGYRGSQIGKELEKLFKMAIDNPKSNKKEVLLDVLSKDNA